VTLYARRDPRTPSVIGILENSGSLLKALGRGEEAAQTYALACAARSHGMEVAEPSLHCVGRSTADLSVDGSPQLADGQPQAGSRMEGGSSPMDLESKTHRQVLEVASGVQTADKVAAI
jgi:hypothetical protein